MPKERILTANEIAEIDLSDRPFLHQQGSTVTRGFVNWLRVEEDRWRLDLRDIQYLDRVDQLWKPGHDADEYTSTIVHEFHFRMDDVNDIVSISGYGSVTHVGPDVENPWRRIHWPPTDYTPEGKLRG